jgi:hypothetical protein
MSDVELHGVVAVWQEQDEFDRRLAWGRGRRSLAGSGRGHLLDDFRDRLARWASDVPSVETGGPLSSGLVAAGSTALTTTEVRRAVGPALLDAALAIILGDLLSRDDHELLAAPIARAGSLRSNDV